MSAVLSIFPALQVERGLPDEYFVNSKEAAFTRMAARFRENTPEAAALRQLLPEILNTRAGWRLCAGRLQDGLRAPWRTALWLPGCSALPLIFQPRRLKPITTANLNISAGMESMPRNAGLLKWM